MNSSNTSSTRRHTCQTMSKAVKDLVGAFKSAYQLDRTRPDIRDFLSQEWEKIDTYLATRWGTYMDGPLKPFADKVRACKGHNKNYLLYLHKANNSINKWLGVNGGGVQFSKKRVSTRRQRKCTRRKMHK